MRHVIVGFDGSDAATAALAWAVEEARLHGAPLTACTVLNQLPARRGRPGGSGTADTLRQSVRQISHDYPAGFRIVHGDAAHELMQACSDADLLVVGSRGRSELTGLLLGSVSRACLHHALCPVVVVRSGVHPRRMDDRVLVGLDGSAAALQALRVAAEEAKERGAVLHAIHAVYWHRVGTELVTPSAEELVAWGRRLVAKQLHEAEVAARPVIIHGRAPDVLVRHSTHADLLVVGSRGHKPLTNLLLGSTSEYCAQHAECPVMIIRRRTHSRPTAEGAS